MLALRMVILSVSMLIINDVLVSMFLGGRSDPIYELGWMPPTHDLLAFGVVYPATPHPRRNCFHPRTQILLKPEGFNQPLPKTDIGVRLWSGAEWVGGERAPDKRFHYFGC